MGRSERMSSVDTTWLRMDRPENLVIIASFTIVRIVRRG